MIITINTQTKKVDKKPQAGDEKLTKAEETTVFAEAIAAATVGMTFERFKKPVARVSFIGVLMKMIFSALQHLEDEEAEKVDRERSC